MQHKCCLVAGTCLCEFQDCQNPRSFCTCLLILVKLVFVKLGSSNCSSLSSPTSYFYMKHTCPCPLMPCTPGLYETAWKSSSLEPKTCIIFTCNWRLRFNYTRAAHSTIKTIEATVALGSTARSWASLSAGNSASGYADCRGPQGDSQEDFLS